MKIIIVGIGKVGSTLVQQLSKEDHDVTIIDTDPNVVNDIVASYDVLGVVGNGANFDTQLRAEVNKAELFIAVTSSDELNILSCLVAQRMKKIKTVARVRDPDYSKQIDFLTNELDINFIINPEYEAAEAITKIIKYPSTLKVDSFSNRKVELVELKMPANSEWIGKQLSSLPKKDRDKILICTVERNKEIIIPRGNYTFAADDKLYVILDKNNMERTFKFLSVQKGKVRNCMIVGGGKITFYLVKNLLDLGIKVKVIESSPERCAELSEIYPDILVICADGSDQALLLEEGLETVDAIVSLTGMDEENIIISMFANSLHVDKVITKINRHQFIDIFEKVGIESIISPKFLTSNQILRYVRNLQVNDEAEVKTLHKIANNRVEAVEFIVNDDEELINISLKDLKLKSNLLVATIIRDGKVIIPTGDDQIYINDTVIIFSYENTITSLHDILL